MQKKMIYLAVLVLLVTSANAFARRGSHRSNSHRGKRQQGYRQYNRNSGLTIGIGEIRLGSSTIVVYYNTNNLGRTGTLKASVARNRDILRGGYSSSSGCRQSYNRGGYSYHRDSYRGHGRGRHNRNDRHQPSRGRGRCSR